MRVSLNDNDENVDNEGFLMLDRPKTCTVGCFCSPELKVNHVVYVFTFYFWIGFIFLHVFLLIFGFAVCINYLIVMPYFVRIIVFCCISCFFLSLIIILF